MTIAIVALAMWVVLSIPVALLLARMFPTSSPPVTAPGGEAASPATAPVTTEVVVGDASNFPLCSSGIGPV